MRGAFEKLYSFLAGELETAAQQGDAPLQFALMDAWGVEVHENDHDLLARVRIFNILQVGGLRRMNNRFFPFNSTICPYCFCVVYTVRHKAHVENKLLIVDLTTGMLCFWRGWLTFAHTAGS